ncbi:hypothetical protein NI443_004811 [Salmonella enterica]|nr:hypothetical protein [Salmonella enterica subsp. enterica serovar Abaetetuba]EJJ4342551.1 hypothetical protein [Salmonella enterica]HCJ1004087.1 hypothetical protein [Salmonella enterica]
MNNVETDTGCRENAVCESILQATGRMPNIVVLLLSDRADGKYPQLSERLLPDRLHYALTMAMTQPGNTRIFQQRQCHLSALLHKLELRNRLELMGLMKSDFI